jgi:putative transposase
MLTKARPSAKYEIIEKMVSQKDNLLNVQLLCEIAGVSRSGFYDWGSSKANRQAGEESDKSDLELILWAYNYRGYKKGAKSIYMRLLRKGIRINIKKIRRLMAKYNVVCPIRSPNPYKRMAKAMATSHVAPNLVAREFKKHGSRRILLTDITYIKRAGGEFTFLSVIIDAYTKQALAWACSTSLKVDFVLETVNILIKRHSSEIDSNTIIHSDQGNHYKLQVHRNSE